MRQLHFVFVLLLSSIMYSQFDLANNSFTQSTIDSIQLSIWEVHTKEMSRTEDEKEFEKELDRISLSDKDQGTLMVNLYDPKSYNETRALLSHYNLVFDLYSGAVISARIRVSTMTGNIDIENNSEEIYFRNSCSQQLGKVLKDLLKKYDYLKLFSELDLEGITTYP